MTVLSTQTLGFPRIGRNREIKRTLEAYWNHRLSEEDLIQTLDAVEEDAWLTQARLGIDRIGVGEGTLYDHMLDWAICFGLIAPRFLHLSGWDRYFAMARGAEGVPALEMTKWFDTNYHYLVPEITPEAPLTLSAEGFLRRISRAKERLGERAVPILIGPLTLLKLSHLHRVDFLSLLERLIPLYQSLLSQIKQIGFREVQIQEPLLVLSNANTLRKEFEQTYQQLAEIGLDIDLVTFFEDLGEAYSWVIHLPVQAISLDFTRGDNLSLLRKWGFPKDKRLGAGMIDARNIWRIQPEVVLPLVQELAERVERLSLQPSAPLQFVPYSAIRETHLPDHLRGVLAFADEKLEELGLIVRAIQEGDGALEEIKRRWEVFHQSQPALPEVRSRLQTLTPEDLQRSFPYSERKRAQRERLKLPPLPLTTIGSFPQTTHIRQVRRQFLDGSISEAEYQQEVDKAIAYVIGLQEGLDLDVLVHGEFERTDMVEYFGQKLTGFAFTRYAWVQSYGHRYVRPPIIYGDVSRPGPITLREFKVAQSLTSKPVKGMLTGPVTILNWSFPRTDLSRREVALQIALALREEAQDLESAGALIIQVDEPALREGLPLKEERRPEYLQWAIEAFRLVTSFARPETQIHTHMCYSEFGEIMEAIDRMDADVISIENARSGDETLQELADYGYSREVGPGVYDVHSPVVPSASEIEGRIRNFLRFLKAEQIWINPDCGLKTRLFKEVIPSLRNMVAAAQAVRKSLEEEVTKTSPITG